MLLIFILLVVTLVTLAPDFIEGGIPTVGHGVTPATQARGLTFLGLAMVQILS